MAPIGQSTATTNKLQPQNSRLDLGLAARQLAENQLAVKPAAF
jgi:hypothetical protein